MMEKNDQSLRKRQQISNANRMMFIWVAGGSAVVGMSIVVSVFLVQQLIFNEKVLTKKNETLSSLEKSQDAITPLRQAIAVRNTDKALLDSRAKPDDKPLQVIIDALPDSPNTAALGASLQTVLIPGQGISIESLTVEPIGGTVGDEESEPTTSQSEGNVMTFSLSVTADKASIGELRSLLQRFERSVRAIKVTNAALSISGDRAELSIKGESYYEPARTLQLGSDTIKPGDK